jgi:hypothetical protein
LRIQFRDRISLNPRFTRWIEVLTEPDLEQRFTQASEALEALRTNRYPKTSIPTIPQPAGSRVQLKKSPNQLSLKIPRRERSLLDIIKLGGNLILTVGSLPFVLLQFLIIVGLVIGLFLTLFYSIFLFFIFLIVTLILGWSAMATSQELTRVQDEVAQALRNLFGHDCLQFDRKYFVIERQLFGLSYLRQVEEISQIKNLQQIPFEELTIQTRMLSYSFAQDLTESERDWLFQEIQDWLNYRG